MIQTARTLAAMSALMLGVAYLVALILAVVAALAWWLVHNVSLDVVPTP